MYLIKKEENTIQSVPSKTFAELGFREREHLQEWIANEPQVLGEELLIIQKEFDGFKDTSERLDLLALDKQGNLVIIENKLDDSGRDVVWQALKYASYCSSLSKEQIKNIYQEYLNKQGKNEDAEAKLNDFFAPPATEYVELLINQGQTQRIIFVASNFRKEVTSAVIWLMSYKLKIQCIKVIPSTWEGKYFLDVEQIIPVKDAEDYIIKMTNKQDVEKVEIETAQRRYQYRFDFWKKLLPRMNAVSRLFQNVSPSKDGWIACGSGISGVPYEFVVTHTYARVELYIDNGSIEVNKYIFDELYKLKDSIETKFGAPLIWGRMDDKRASRIKYDLTGVDVFDQTDWDRMVSFMVDGMVKFEGAIKEPLKVIGLSLRNRDNRDLIIASGTVCLPLIEEKEQSSELHSGNIEQLSDTSIVTVFEGAVEGGRMDLFRRTLPNDVHDFFVLVNNSACFDENDIDKGPVENELRLGSWDEAWNFLLREHHQFYIHSPLIIHPDYLPIFKEYLLNNKAKILEVMPWWGKYLYPEWVRFFENGGVR